MSPITAKSARSFPNPCPAFGHDAPRLNFLLDMDGAVLLGQFEMSPILTCTENGDTHFLREDDESLYLAAALDPMVLQGTSILRAMIAVEAQSDDDSLSLLCRYHDAAGVLITDHAITPDRGAVLLKVPQGAETLSIGLMLSGSGRFFAPFIRIERIDKPIPAFTDPDAATRIHEHGLARRYASGLAVFEALPVPDDAARKQALRCYAHLHDFEAVCRMFDTLSPRLQAQAHMQLIYLRALANLGRMDDCRAIIAQARDVDFLLCAYPFAVHISQALADQVLAHILPALDTCAKKHFNALIRCAHDLYNQKRPDEAAAFHRRAERLAASAGERARLDLLRAQAAYADGHAERMLVHINAALGRYNAYPLSMLKGGTLDFHRVSCPLNAPKSAGGPLVSILMPSFNNGSTIDYALRSLMQQTYANIEILVIDDASRDDSRDQVRRLMKADRRITLIEQPENAGTYVARNTGLARARGDFVTCQDADDWAHPEKIETLAQTLMNDPALIAATVSHFRYSPERGLRGRGGYVQNDFSSLTYRRETILERVGFFDSVRAGGDSEFLFRIERAFGRSAIRHLPHILSLVLWSETSLSGGGRFAIDDDAGILTPFRNAYRGAFLKWQDRTPDLYIDFPQTQRPFDVPQEGLP